MSQSFKQKLKDFFIKAYYPKPTVDGTIKLFIGFGFFFILIGVMFTVTNASIKTYKKRYDNVCKNLNETCELTIELSDEIKQPVFFFYGLTNFYQNHRRYIKSKSNLQLAGNNIEEAEAKQFCSPVMTNGQMNKNQSVDGTTLNKNDIASPCGLIAYSYFTDGFRLYNKDNVEIEMKKDKITWPSDKGYKFKNGPDWQKKQWINVEDENFIVWMRTSGLPEFDKIYGRIEQDLKPGQYKLQIDNNYDQKQFNGEKSIYLSNSGLFGGKNRFLEISYYLFGCICFLISLMFYVKKKVSKEGEFGSNKLE